MKKALLIGINYKSIPDISLNGCIDDIINMREMLVNQYLYDASNIVMLRDDVQSDVQNGSVSPTYENIMRELQDLVSNSINLDELWVHYSGHGSRIHDLHSDLQNQKNPIMNNSLNLQNTDDIIIPIDYKENGIIRDDELLSVIQKIDKKCHSIFVFDCCHSGTICELPWTYMYNDMSNNISNVMIKNTFSRTLNHEKITIENPNICVMSGCRDDQTSSDSYDYVRNEAVGAFTNTFITCLRDISYNTTIIELYRNICDRMKVNGYSQIPVLSSSSMNPEFIFSNLRTNMITSSKTPINTTNTINTTTNIQNPIKTTNNKSILRQIMKRIINW